jgi:hypothetical protein
LVATIIKIFEQVKKKMMCRGKKMSVRLAEGGYRWHYVPDFYAGAWKNAGGR